MSEVKETSKLYKFQMKFTVEKVLCFANFTYTKPLNGESITYIIKDLQTQLGTKKPFQILEIVCEEASTDA